MTAIIEKANDRLILVNGKEVRIDMDGRWIATNLNMDEAKFFGQFLFALEQAWGKHIKKMEFRS